MRKEDVKKGSIYELDGVVPLKEALPLGIQHVLAMFLGNISPLLIIAGMLGLSPDLKSALIQNAMFIAGAVTLVQLYPVWKIGAKLPIVMGTSSGFIGTAKAMGALYGYGALMGASLIGGLFEMVLGFFIKPLRKLFPPVVTSLVIISIGLSLLPVGINYFGGGSGAADFGDPKHLLVGTFVILVIIIAKQIKGFVNNASILIGIIARFPDALIQEVVSRVANKSGGLIMFIIEIVFLLLVIGAAILLVQGTRKIPVQYAKRIVGNKQYGGARQYIPLKVNAAGVMPIIFAQAIMFIPISIVGFSSTGEQSGFVAAFMDNTGFWYNFVFAVLIILFTYFYTAITINPTQMSDDLKRNNGFIPGVKPGKSTKDYLDTIMDRITLPGAFFLALVAIMPAFARIAGVSMEFSQFFGGTSLLILVGVVLDTLQQVESHLLMRHYDGLLKSGRIKGRSGAVGAY